MISLEIAFNLNLIELYFFIFRAGLIFYEYYRIQQRLNMLISPYVLNAETKHPDYIYIKYHIYKESMEQRKNAELQGKVKEKSSFYL